jgi:hypothetical protein
MLLELLLVLSHVSNPRQVLNNKQQISVKPLLTNYCQRPDNLCQFESVSNWSPFSLRGFSVYKRLV